MRTFLFLLILSIAFTSKSESIIDRYFTPKLGVNCKELKKPHEWSEVAQIIAPMVWDKGLWKWLSEKKDSAYEECQTGRNIVTYEGHVSIQSACVLLDMDPKNYFVVYNSLVEITKDHESNGDVCTIEGLIW